MPPVPKLGPFPPDLDPDDVGATHAAALVDEEEDFPGDRLEVSRHTAHLRAEVQHQDRVVEDVFVESLLNEGHL